MEETQQYNFKGQLDGSNRKFTIGNVEHAVVLLNGEALTEGSGYELAYDQGGGKVVIMDTAPQPTDELIVELSA